MGTAVFNYKYKYFNGEDKLMSIEFPLPFHESAEKLVDQLLTQINPMVKDFDLHIDLKKTVDAFVREKNQEYYDENDDQLLFSMKENTQNIESFIKNIEKYYRDEMVQFADRVGPTDEDIFAQSFHRLVHSSSLEEILLKERGYAKVIREIIKRMDSEVNALNSKQQKETDSKIGLLGISTTDEDITNLFAEQCSTQNYIRQKFQSELEAGRGHQKNEYREWITSQVSKVFQSSPATTPLGNRSSTFVSQTPLLEESFTIHLGSQLKHMHNIRILSVKVTDLCSPLHDEESLNGLNMALGLYSSSLCGVVILTPSTLVQANKEIIKMANLSTEFHFDQIDDQLEKIQNDVKLLNEKENNSPGSSSKLKVGDFFVTKHSNLSQTHIIFHLVSDEPLNSPLEINSRHPVILGLRNILKIASRHDVTTLTIPALLRHEMSEAMTVPWCIRRAELIFKCTKGFMIESASWGGAELGTLQLLLPHDISEDLFTTLAGMVPNVFRLANPKILVDNSKSSN